MRKIPELHKATAPRSLGISIITCSTSKFNELRAGKKPEDTSGDIIERSITRAGHRLQGRNLISDSRPMIEKITRKALASKNVDAVIITGGTGLSRRDVTVESITPMLQKELPGFGELFRKVSFDTIGSPAILSRAIAGTIKGKAIFCLPGSPNAVQTALEKLILPELGHIIRVSREH